MNKQFLINARQNQVVSHASQKYAMQCRGCGKIVDLVTFAEACEIVGATTDEIINRASSGAIHIAVRPEALLVCLNSLLSVDFSSLQETLTYRAEKKRTAKASC